MLSTTNSRLDTYCFIIPFLKKQTKKQKTIKINVHNVQNNAGKYQVILSNNTGHCGSQQTLPFYFPVSSWLLSMFTSTFALLSLFSSSTSLFWILYQCKKDIIQIAMIIIKLLQTTNHVHPFIQHVLRPLSVTLRRQTTMNKSEHRLH